MTRYERIGDNACAGNCVGCKKRVALSNEQISKCVLKDLNQSGFARFDMKSSPKTYDHSLKQLQKAAREMPIDQTTGGAGRSRIHGRVHLLPWLPQGEELVCEPGRVHQFNGEFGLEFTQPASVNSVAQGKRRVFKPFCTDLYLNDLVQDLIRTLWNALPFDQDTRSSSMVVGLHLIKLAPSGAIPAVASPDLVHRDGEPFTAGVLIDRRNVNGGFNSITHTRWHDHRFGEVPASDIYDEFTLQSPLEGYIVQDDRVAHYVSPVSSVDPNEHAERTILLVDFTPSRPVINLDGIE